MLFSSVTFGFALFSYAFQTYSKLSEETIKYMKEKSEAATKAAANAAFSEMGDLTDKLSLAGSISGIFKHKSDAENIVEENSKSQ